MPQMSPFNWMVMFSIFIGSFILAMCKLFNSSPQFFTRNDSNNSLYLETHTNKFWMW